MSAPLPPRSDSTLANVVHIGAASLAGVAAQIVVGFGQVFLPIEFAEDRQLSRIAGAVAGVAAGAAAAWMQARRQIARGELEAAASPFAIAVCVASAFALSAIAGPLLYTPGRRWDSEEGTILLLTMVLLPLAVWLGLRLRRSNQRTTRLRPEQSEIVALALADLDAIDVQFSGLHAYRGDPRALSEHAAAAYAAVSTCESAFKPLLPDADARFIEQACAAYREAAMIPMLLCDEDPGATEYIRSAAARLGTAGDKPEQVADAAVREARLQRNLAADAAGLARNPHV